MATQAHGNYSAQQVARLLGLKAHRCMHVTTVLIPELRATQLISSTLNDLAVVCVYM